MRLRYEVFHQDDLASAGWTTRGGDGVKKLAATHLHAIPTQARVLREVVLLVVEDREPEDLYVEANHLGHNLVVDDIDAEYVAVRAAGYQLADGLTRRPWGLRDFRLFDPTGQYLRVTE